MSPPPPPPPHGEAPRQPGGSGLPPGNYDIFIIPEHSAGAGFLYLPSLRPSINSFVAGFATALAVVALGHSMAPAFQVWWANFQGMGNVGLAMLVFAVAMGAWSLGRVQQDSGGPHGNSGPGATGPGMGSAGSQNNARYSSPPPPPPPPQEEPRAEPPPQSPPRPGAQYAEQPKPSWQQQEQQQQEQQQPPPKPSWQQQQEQQQQTPPPPKPSWQAPQENQQTPPKPSWQQQQGQQQYKPRPPPPKPNTSRAEATKGAWEKAREEIRKKEEERKAQEAEKRRREEAAQKLRELREKEARERAERERRDKDLQEKRTKDLRERLDRDKRERERLEKEVREKIEREQREKLEREQREEREKREKEAAAAEIARLRKTEDDRTSRKGSSYAFSAVGEKTNPWPNGKPPPPAAFPTSKKSTATPSVAPSVASHTPSKAPPKTPSHASSYAPSQAPSHAPSQTGSQARTETGTQIRDEDETYSYRPYDKPKRPYATRKKSVSDFSESSWAPSMSTARTTPPPSMRTPYTTNDPDKIVIKAVYGFINQFAKTPSSQLVSGVGTVTDGLILRIATEGLFIDDDVRGVPQREWDVKTWTLKLVEVWCPAHAVALANSAANENDLKPAKPAAAKVNQPAWRRTAAAAAYGTTRGDPRPLTDENADAYLNDMLRECKALCSLGLCDAALCACAFGASASAASSSATSETASSFSASSAASSHNGTNARPSPFNPQTGEWKSKGLHLLRATVRDQEGKRYLFVIGQEEAWKVSVGLQRLRKGTQVRSLGVAGLSNTEVKTTLELLGWG